jgi:hypothetical protein
MLHEQRTDVEGDSPEALLAEYEADLRTVIDEHGVDAVAAETSLDAETVAALIEGESPPLSLPEAAAIQALAPDAPDADTIVEMACEHLLLGMSMAVLDVETLAGELDGDLSAKEVQQKLERRSEMSLEEFAAIEYAIVDRQY